MIATLGLDNDTWAALNTIGTFLAIVVALYLGVNSNRPNLRVRCGIKVLAFPGDDLRSAPEYFHISATNIGSPSVKVIGIFWTYGLFRKTTLITVAALHQAGDRPPKLIGCGESAELLFELDTAESAAKKAFDTAGKSKWRAGLVAKTLRCGVYTSHGNFAVRLDGTTVARLKSAPHDQQRPAL